MNKKYCFVPRDAGFFSVFNFLIGGLTQDLILYPLFNKQELLSRYYHNQHFCYWTNNFNSWFDYFEPIKYFPEDTTHFTEEYLKLPRYCGEKGPDEFRIPKITKELLTGNKEKFNLWRYNVHSYFKSFISFKPWIIDAVNQIWSNNFDSQNIIGIHYRHPSHFVESGKIYLEDYFEKIDLIVQDKPDSKFFLASDSKFGIYAFTEKYGDRVVYVNDIDRLTMSEFLHWSFSLSEGRADKVGFINGKGYELHHKRVNNEDNTKMTIDLLIEVLCLSKCHQLINTTSNIPLAISYINPNIEIITL